MESISFSFSANAIGVVVSGLSILGLFVAIYRYHLPSSKFKELEQLLLETEAMYDSIVEANLLPDQELQEDIKGRLAGCVQTNFFSACGILSLYCFLGSRLRNEMYEHRRRVYVATTLPQQYKQFFKGLSCSIGRTSGNIKDIRALILVSVCFTASHYGKYNITIYTLRSQAKRSDVGYAFRLARVAI